MKMYNPNSTVRTPMMYGGKAQPNKKKMAYGGAMSAPMGAGMMQDKKKKNMQGMMMGMKNGGKVNTRSR